MVKEAVRTNEAESTIDIGFKNFALKLFPELRHTNVPDIVSSMLVDIYPLCRIHKDLASRELIIKGSTIKRYLLGDPDGYWDISRIYQHVDKRILKGEAKQLVERFALGPRDIDFRYDLAAGRQDQDVYQALAYSLENQGFSSGNGAFSRKIQGQNYKVIINQTEIGGINGPSRTFYNVLLYVNDRFLLRTDFGRLADLNGVKQMHDEFRVSLYFPVEESLSHAQVNVDRNQVRLRINRDLIDFFDSVWSVKLFHVTSLLPLVLMGKLKGLGFRTFWPVIDKKTAYDYDRLRQLFLEASYSNLYPWLRLSNDANLEKRKAEYVSDFLLYLTYDPFLFFRLLVDLNFLPITALDRYITSWDDLSVIMLNMAEEIDPQVIPDEVILNPAKYSRLYKKKVLKEKNSVEATGPFMLIRAINNLLAQKGETGTIEESFASLIQLFDPNNSDIIKAKTEVEKLDYQLVV